MTVGRADGLSLGLSYHTILYQTMDAPPHKYVLSVSVPQPASHAVSQSGLRPKKKKKRVNEPQLDKVFFSFLLPKCCVRETTGRR